MALKDYDMRFFQPHPPGDPLYVLLAKGFSVFADPNLALQLATQTVYLSFLFLLLAPCRGVAGWVAGLLVLTSPLFWKQSVVANPDMSEALLFLLMAKRLRTRKGWFAQGWGAWLLGFLLGLRPGALLLLAPPFFLYLLFHERDFLCQVGCFLGGVLLWLLPQIVATGGPDAWLEAYALRLDLLRAGAQAVSAAQRAKDALSGGLFALSGGLLLLLTPSVWRGAYHRWDGGLLIGPALFMLFVLSDVASFWTGPAALFFFYLSSAKDQRDVRDFLGKTLATCGLGLNLFALTVWVMPGIAQRQKVWQDQIACVKKHTLAAKSLVVSRFVPGPQQPLFFRHATVYLTAWRVWHLRRLDPPTWWIYDGEGRRERVAEVLPLPEDVRVVVLAEPTSLSGVEWVRCGSSKIALLEEAELLRAKELIPPARKE